MQLKFARDIEWQDLLQIEAPFFARTPVKEAFHNPLTSMRGIHEILDKDYPSYNAPRRNHHALDQLLEQLDNGKIFLLHDLSDPSDPITPVMHWEADDAHKDKGRWEITVSESIHSLKWHLEWILSTLKTPQDPPRPPLPT
jgi:hypothetical protein